MELSVPEWIDLAKQIFDKTIKKYLPQAEYQITIDDYRITFTVFVDDRQEFEILSSLELLEISFLQKFSNVMMLQYPDQDFAESLSEILQWIAKYYDGGLEIIEYETRIFKKKLLSMRDKSSGESLQFRYS